MDRAYLDLLDALVSRGEKRASRAGATRGLFDYTLTWSPTVPFEIPLLSCRLISFKIAWAELLMFLRGETQTRVALEEPYGITIWKGNTTQTQGEIGPMYGYQWRKFGRPFHASSSDSQGVDTFESFLSTLIDDPSSRRLVFSSLNMAQVHEGVLWPCHGLVVQWHVDQLTEPDPVTGQRTGRLSVKQTQRSCDAYHGLPYNLVSYALLMHVVMRLVHDRTGGKLLLTPGRVICSLGDVHVYENHVPAATVLLNRRAMDAPYPRIRWTRTRPLLSVDDLAFEDLELVPEQYRPCRDPLPPAPFNA